MGELNKTQKPTARLAVAAEQLSEPSAQRVLVQAAEVLRTGGTVAFPTETVYGLGANALDAQAVKGIFTAKQRPAWDPLIVHVSSRAMLERVATKISARAQSLMDAFWPGPLTLLLPKLAAISGIVTAGRPLVGVRMPAHPIARALIAMADVPVAAPSANRFGHTSPTTAQHVVDDLDGRIDVVLDGGPTSCGVESTVIEVNRQEIVLYRHGAISVEELESVGGPVAIYQPPETLPLPQSLPSPGVGIRHYAPNATVIPVEVGAEPEANQQAQWLREIARHSAGNIRVGLMLPAGWPLPQNFSGVQYVWGYWQNDRELAQKLFAGLRQLDDAGVDTIFCPLPSSKRLGAALRDRLLKAAR